MHSQDKLDSLYDSQVAIIGMVCKFPGANNIDEFWRNLREGTESISFFSEQELIEAGVDSATVQSSNYVRAKGMLKGVDMFDAPFFGINPKDAEIMDPQHRLFLETSWDALESAGYNPETCEGRVGIFAGVSINTYLLYNLWPNRELLDSVDGLQALLANDKDFLATRVSYKLNLRGPAVSVQTACSTSMVAVHLACQSLLNGECDMALAGGSSIRLPEKSGYFYKEGGVMSPDGHCRAFDAKSQGTVGGNGVGIVVLKRLADALADGDYIHAVIKGSAINNDGSMKVGYTAPRAEGQAEVIADALAVANVGAETIEYIEAHGTATGLGDVIEVAALTEVFQAATEKKAFCAIGSVKTNIGHLDAAAGVAGLIKTVQALKHKEIPANLHFESPNPKIDFQQSPFYVNTALKKWGAGEWPRRAGVSSFGIGGTNAHLVVEEHTKKPSSDRGRSRQLLLLSARSEQALNKTTQNLAEYLKDRDGGNLSDVAFTLHIGRKKFNHRRIVVSDNDVAAAVRALEESDSLLTGFEDASDRPVIFMFPDVGAHYVKMGKDLYDEERDFREEVDRCTELLMPHLELDIRKAIYTDLPGLTEDSSKLDHAILSQPSLFVIEYALAKLWMKWGVKPKAMIGHGLGEYVASCLAGVLSLADSLRLVALRGRLMQDLPQGGMFSGSISEKDLQFVGPFLREVGTIRLNTPHIPYISNLTGTWITDEQALDPDYWVNHLTAPVRFGSGVEELLKDPEVAMLEVGPGQSLAMLVRRHPNKGNRHVVLSSMRLPHEDRSDIEFLLEMAGQLWVSGIQIDPRGFFDEQIRTRVPLPTYPFEREKYWIEAKTKTNISGDVGQRKSVRADICDWYYVPVWKQSLIGGSAERTIAQDEKVIWLIFADEIGIAKQLGIELRARDQQVVTVTKGEYLSRQSPVAYQINWEQESDYEALLAELRETYGSSIKIVHLWSINDQPEDETVLHDEKRYKAALYSLIFLAQALAEQGGEPATIWVITNNVYDVIGEEQLRPMNALILGPCKAIPQIHLNITCRNIDIVISKRESSHGDRFFARIVDELIFEQPDPTVAYRRGRRWVQLFDPIRLDQGDQSKSWLKKNGVYLITRGLDDVGFRLSEHLAKNARAKLVLVGKYGGLSKNSWEEFPVNGVQGQNALNVADQVDNMERLEDEIEASFGIDLVRRYEEFEDSVDELCSSYAYKYLAMCNIGVSKGTVHGIEDLRTKLAITPKLNRLYDYLLKILSEDKIISSDGKRITFLKDDTEIEVSHALQRRLEERYPEFKGLLKLLDHCARNYDKAMTGAVMGTNVLYPDGTSHFLDELLKEVKFKRERVYTRLAKEIISEILKKRPGKKFRILEIGAGQGGFTRVILPALAGHDVEYWFTDVSKYFVMTAKAEAERRGADFMKFGILDVSKDPIEQGYEESSFDMILSLNVIHAGREIAESIRQLKRLTKPGGLIFVIETVRASRWAQMTWGLAEHWWIFDDTDLRTENILLSLDQWERVFRDVGFESVKTYPQSEEKRLRSDSGLLIAQLHPESNLADHSNLALIDQPARCQEQVSRMRRLEELGSEVMVVDADIDNSAQMESVVQQARERFRDLHGVIHTGLTPPSNGNGLKTSYSINNESIDRVNETRALYSACAGARLDFFALFSTLGSITNFPRDLGNCAMDSFLDSFAHYAASKGQTNAVSINWSKWRDLGDSGIDGSEIEESLHKSQNYENEITVKEGLEGLGRILRKIPAPQVAVIPIGHQVSQSQSRSTKLSTQEVDQLEEQKAKHSRPLMYIEYIAPSTPLEQTLAAIWENVLGIDRIGINDKFLELGGDSLIGGQIVSRLKEAFHFDLPVRALFEFPTIAELAEIVGEQIMVVMEAMSEEEAKRLLES